MTIWELLDQRTNGQAPGNGGANFNPSVWPEMLEAPSAPTLQDDSKCQQDGWKTAWKSSNESWTQATEAKDGWKSGWKDGWKSEWKGNNGSWTQASPEIEEDIDVEARPIPRT